MKNYEAPQAQVVSFVNDYVTAKNWNKPQGCSDPTGSGKTFSNGQGCVTSDD